MFDHMIFGAVLAAILVVILALLKLAIEYPGVFSWCMRSVHKRTERHSGGENDDSTDEDSPDPEHLHLSMSKLSRRGSRLVSGCRSQGSMSRTATDPEIAKRRLELDEIVTFDETPPHDSHSRLAEIKKKSNYDRRYSNDHHHHKKHHRDQRDHYDRRHSSHDHHHHRHHHQKKKHLHHRHAHDHHHSSTSFEEDSPGGKRRALMRLHHHDHPRPQEIVITDSSQERVNGDSPASSNSLETIKKAHSSNMRININNVNILIPRHLPKDVTINIDMDEEEETELVTAALDNPDQNLLHLETHHHEAHHEDHHDPHEHHEVRSSDSGIGWDDHHSHDHQDQDHHQDHHHDQVPHDVNTTVVDIEPIAEEDQERNTNVESDDSKVENFVAKLDCIPLKDPRRPRHNTFT